MYIFIYIYYLSAGVAAMFVTFMFVMIAEMMGLEQFVIGAGSFRGLGGMVVEPRVIHKVIAHARTEPKLAP